MRKSYSDVKGVTFQQKSLEAFIDVDRTSMEDILALLAGSISHTERQKLDEVWAAIWKELTPEQIEKMRSSLRAEGDEWLADAVILKFIRANDRPVLVRGDIKGVSTRVSSLARKVEAIGGELCDISEALHGNTSSGINIVAAETSLRAHEVEMAVANLQSAISLLEQKRDEVIKAHKRENAARLVFVREWALLWGEVGLSFNGDDRITLEGVIAGVVEKIEGEVGRGQREWVVGLVDKTIAAIISDET